VKAGDLVRFKPPYFIRKVDGVFGMEGSEGKGNLLGLLIEYEAWEKMASVMYNGEILRIPARDVEKFGKRGLNI
jgi:hypothetical protein